MARRIRWQILIAAVCSLIVLGLIGYLALTTAAVARPLTGGAYVEGLTVAPRQLNPLVSDPTRDQASADIQALVFDGLVRIGEDGLPGPALASSWDISGDGMVYTFTLRPDVSWQDGTPVSVDDVLFTLRAVQGTNFFGDPTAASLWRNIVLDKVGDRQVRCKLTTPFAPFLSRATFPILPAHLLRDIPPEQWSSAPFSQKPVGTGPYELVELNGEHALLRRNPDYYGGQAFLDSIEFRFLKSAEEAIPLLSRGELNGIGYAGTDALRQNNLPRTIVRHSVPLDGYTVLTFNLRQGPLTDQGLRRALATGLDKDALIGSALGGQAERLDTPILKGSWASAPDIPWYTFSSQKATELLTSLGYTRGPDGTLAKDGAPLALPLITDSSADRVAAAQEIARQWGALGVKVDVQQLDDDSLRKRLDAHDFTMALIGWQRLGSDPDVLELWHSSYADGGRNYAGLKDEQLDKLLVSGRQTSDTATRLGTYRAFQQRWIDLAPSITLYQPQFVYATAGDLGGLDLDAQPGTAPDANAIRLLLGREDRFRNVTGWFLRSSREIRGNLRSAP